MNEGKDEKSKEEFWNELWSVKRGKWRDGGKKQQIDKRPCWDMVSE